MLKIGQEVVVFKSGEVIPKVISIAHNEKLKQKEAQEKKEAKERKEREEKEKEIQKLKEKEGKVKWENAEALVVQTTLDFECTSSKIYIFVYVSVSVCVIPLSPPLFLLTLATDLCFLVPFLLCVCFCYLSL